MAHTFLRDSFYLDFVEDLVGEDGVIRGPAGVGAMAAVARADVARIATEVLLHPSDHVDRTYELTGPEAITLAQAAATVSEVRGRAVTYQPETVAEAYASRARWNPEPWQADAWVSTYTAIAEGAGARLDGRRAGHRSSSAVAARGAAGGLTCRRRRRRAGGRPENGRSPPRCGCRAGTPTWFTGVVPRHSCRGRRSLRREAMGRRVWLCSGHSQALHPGAPPSDPRQSDQRSPGMRGRTPRTFGRATPRDPDRGSPDPCSRAGLV